MFVIIVNAFDESMSGQEVEALAERVLDAKRATSASSSGTRMASRLSPSKT